MASNKAAAGNVAVTARPTVVQADGSGISIRAGFRTGSHQPPAL